MAKYRITQVISKNGDRKVVCGPQTVMLDYDQTLEELQLSTGKPKTTDNLIRTCFLRHENNKVSDMVNVETKDFVRCTVKVSYCVDFDKDYMDKWFNIDNYVKFMTDRERSLLKRAAKNYTIEEFYQNYITIVRDVAIARDRSEVKDADKAAHKGRFFPENGMYVSDCEVLSIDVERDVYQMLTDHQREMVERSLELSTADKRVQVAEQLAIAEKKENEVESQKLINKMNLQREEAVRKLAIQSEVNRMKEAEAEASKKAEQDLQVIIDAVADADRERKKKDLDQDLAYKNAIADIEKAKQKAYADTVSQIMTSIAPGLIEALTSNANVDLLNGLNKAVGPYAIANGESVADVANKLLRGLPVESLLKNLVKEDE